MRVISGKFKGLHMKAVPGQSTRPTTDKVKESIFNMVGPYFDGGSMLDLYGGSGAIAIEALSRGIEKAVIIDRDRKAIETIYMNIKSCKIEDEVEVYRTEASRALNALRKKGSTFDLIFLDPPYLKQRLEEELLFIAEHRLLDKLGKIVVEHAATVELNESYSDLTKIREERYGDTIISIYSI
ncbi:16S rRNA (guanine(966)-N(2))-methyltransferase RsmD [Evansella cellulosilytica]|uniref:Methyltransferase n=1 Tax=Evansella cellulosilytica (strain ATCC 21833 / DSM 2522 / FERM P-1141 / JCM 9156 / N-4) TaxID=649639 RepID=E6TUI2_EVAC2|nr:16S rRNA (guanine(966)-N(2))-methyltransferase RsmD [Evansella cellulosilytica]ADU30872.1 methyltransferase [Evansella cellulosilytica DSM 2522]